MSDEQASLDEVRANMQVSLTDLNRRQRALPAWGGGNPSLGQTDFEGYQLNTMLDMIESARPSDLEAAADALSNASDAIEGVGEDIKKYAADVDWEGESGEAFRTWADNLGKNTLKLASYTSQAGFQMRAASIGLASVKSGMPPREEGPYLPVDGSKANAAEDPREKNRQEAITQMNRLSSFYKVSRDTLAAQEEPDFAPPPDFGVPAPRRDRFPVSGDSQDVDHSAGSGNRNPSAEAPIGINAALESRSLAMGPVGTDINAANAQQANPVESTPLRTGPPTNSSSSVPNSYSGVPSPVGTAPGLQQKTGRNAHLGGPPGQGLSPYQPKSGPRAGARTSGTPPVGGRPPGPAMGSPTPGGRTPHSSFPAKPRRPDAILGGMPYQPRPAGPSPIPQGRVAGVEASPGVRTPMVGSPGAAGPLGNTGYVAPDRRRTTGQRGMGGGSGTVPTNRTQSGGFFTPGGMGLVSRPGTSRAEPHEEGRQGTRPDYLSEDEKTWKARRDIVPPVVE